MSYSTKEYFKTINKCLLLCIYCKMFTEQEGDKRGYKDPYFGEMKLKEERK